MKKIFIGLLILGFSLSSMQAKSDAQAQNEVRDSVVFEGPANICVYNIYTKCYKVSQSQCKSKIKPMLEQCFNQNKSQITGLTAQSQIAQIRTKIGKCAALKYQQALSSQVDQKCLDAEVSKLK